MQAPWFIGVLGSCLFRALVKVDMSTALQRAHRRVRGSAEGRSGVPGSIGHLRITVNTLNIA